MVVVALGLQGTGSVVVAHRLTCCASGFFLDQGSNLCLLKWQTDFPPLSQQGSLYIHIPSGYIIFNMLLNPVYSYFILDFKIDIN